MTTPVFPHAAPPPGPERGLQSLPDAEQALAIVRFLEAAPSVRRRYQFFVWTQSQMQALVPHQLMVCGAYQRHRRSVVFDAFHSVVLSSLALRALTEPQAPLVQALSGAWVAQQGRPLAMGLDELGGEAAEEAALLAQELGCRELLVHGVARPQRPAEIESLFILGGPAAAEGSTPRLLCLDWLLPQLHRTWQRVVATEHELLRPAQAPVQRPPAAPATERGGAAITLRERQILAWVREGKSNQQIAEALGISPLTVKNHIQKILRKLDASNRAQAVALAISRRLLDGSEAAGRPTP